MLPSSDTTNPATWDAYDREVKGNRRSISGIEALLLALHHLLRIETKIPQISTLQYDPSASTRNPVDPKTDGDCDEAIAEGLPMPPSTCFNKQLMPFVKKKTPRR
ncbi:hypothetical protein BDZ97DRAFT_1757180 [Flammula alnicola]|nr:hypothetical protein BDZ97DRAFT_1757180 [Flammula alnicola]